MRQCYVDCTFKKYYSLYAGETIWKKKNKKQKLKQLSFSNTLWILWKLIIWRGKFNLKMEILSYMQDHSMCNGITQHIPSVLFWTQTSFHATSLKREKKGSQAKTLKFHKIVNICLKANQIKKTKQKKRKKEKGFQQKRSIEA